MDQGNGSAEVAPGIAGFELMPASFVDEVGPRDIFQATAAIVASAIPVFGVSQSELPAFVNEVHQALSALAGAPAQAPAEPVAPPVPAVPIKKSITPDYLISLEDGRRYKALKRHLRGLGMTPAQYRVKWGLPADYPMVAPNYAKQRSDLAKASGLGTHRKAE